VHSLAGLLVALVRLPAHAEHRPLVKHVLQAACHAAPATEAHVRALMTPEEARTLPHIREGEALLTWGRQVGSMLGDVAAAGGVDTRREEARKRQAEMMAKMRAQQARATCDCLLVVVVADAG
jgi:hypothetical protein